ncbi:hypothetical protein CFC21_042733, partial [Triticum aestivum]
YFYSRKNTSIPLTHSFKFIILCLCSTNNTDFSHTYR